jgi:hypothetical protein
MMTLEKFVNQLEIKDSVSFKNLTLFPLAGDVSGHLDYILAEDAIKAGNFSVTEVSDSGSVPELLVTNSCDQMILLIDGEELIGAKQNRILNVSILVPPQSKMKVPVSCVEQGRWSHRTAAFSSGKFAPSRVRAPRSKVEFDKAANPAQSRSDQGEVWQEVGTMLRACQTRSHSAAMSDIVLQKQKTFDAFVQALPFPTGSRGVLASINGRFEAMDVFESPRLWSRSGLD